MTMALFGLLWLMRIRVEVKKEKRNRRNSQRRRRRSSPSLKEPSELLPVPIPFADDVTDALPVDPSIPIPPPPPVAARQRALIHLHQRADSYYSLRNQQKYLSRSAQNISVECTCPSVVSRPHHSKSSLHVRFQDDPFGFHSGRGSSWDYPSVLSTLPRQRRTNHRRSAQGADRDLLDVVPVLH